MDFDRTFGASLIFRISQDAYRQVNAWQRSVNRSILRHQLENRGQALVIRDGGHASPEKIDQLPQQGEVEPYYGTTGGAYRYTFHPTPGSCEVEVLNQMGGFAFFAPRPFEPLHIRLPVLPEWVYQHQTQLPVTGPATGLPPGSLEGILIQNKAAGEMCFQLPEQVYSRLLSWAWFGRPLEAYDFIFVPMAGNGVAGCMASVRMRDTGAVLVLTKEQVV